MATSERFGPTAGARGRVQGSEAVHPQPPHLRRVITLWAVLSVLGMVATVLVLPLILPKSGSDAAGFQNLTYIVFTVAAVPVALFVWVFVGYSLAVFRVRGRSREDGPPLRATPRIQLGWLGVTGALTTFLVVWGLVGLYQQSDNAAHALTVNVTAQQWAWTFQYPETGISSHFLELPANRPVRFAVTSRDVLHGFSIQELGVRLDANPGLTATTVAVTPDKTGDYTVRCMELCGNAHSLMEAPVHVVSQQAFSAWISKNGGHS